MNAKTTDRQRRGASLGCVVLIFALTGSAHANLFDFEAGVDGWTVFGLGAPAVVASAPADANSGTGALQFTHSQNVAFDGTIQTNLPFNNWSAFNTLTYWVKAGAPGNTNEVTVEILESSGELWKQRVRTVVTDTYQRVDLDLEGFVDSGFDVSSGGADFSLSITNIRQMNFVFFPKNPGPVSPVSYFIDDVVLSSNTPSSTLGVTPSAVAFGPLTVQEGTTRFASTALTASYSAASAGWRLEVATDNALDVNGLVATDGGSAGLLMKVWTPDFGEGVASNVPPDPNSGANWTGGTAVYKFVLDVDVQGSGSNSTVAVDGLNPDAADIPFHFAVDAGGAVVTTYTGTITLDLVFP